MDTVELLSAQQAKRDKVLNAVGEILTARGFNVETMKDDDGAFALSAYNETEKCNVTLNLLIPTDRYEFAHVKDGDATELMLTILEREGHLPVVGKGSREWWCVDGWNWSTGQSSIECSGPTRAWAVAKYFTSVLTS